jgi:hypothetical protein
VGGSSGRSAKAKGHPGPRWGASRRALDKGSLGTQPLGRDVYVCVGRSITPPSMQPTAGGEGGGSKGN